MDPTQNSRKRLDLRVIPAFQDAHQAPVFNETDSQGSSREGLTAPAQANSDIFSLVSECSMEQPRVRRTLSSRPAPYADTRNAQQTLPRPLEAPPHTAATSAAAKPFPPPPPCSEEPLQTADEGASLAQRQLLVADDASTASLNDVARDEITPPKGNPDTREAPLADPVLKPDDNVGEQAQIGTEPGLGVPSGAPAKWPKDLVLADNEAAVALGNTENKYAGLLGLAIIVTLPTVIIPLGLGAAGGMADDSKRSRAKKRAIQSARAVINDAEAGPIAQNRARCVIELLEAANSPKNGSAFSKVAEKRSAVLARENPSDSFILARAAYAALAANAEPSATGSAEATAWAHRALSLDQLAGAQRGMTSTNTQMYAETALSNYSVRTATYGDFEVKKSMTTEHRLDGRIRWKDKWIDKKAPKAEALVKTQKYEDFSRGMFTALATGAAYLSRPAVANPLIARLNSLDEAIFLYKQNMRKKSFAAAIAVLEPFEAKVGGVTGNADDVPNLGVFSKNPDTLHALLGFAHAEAGDHARAASAFEKSLKQEPRNKVVRDQLAHAQEALAAVRA